MAYWKERGAVKTAINRTQQKQIGTGQKKKSQNQKIAQQVVDGRIDDKMESRRAKERSKGRSKDRKIEIEG